MPTRVDRREKGRQTREGKREEGREDRRGKGRQKREGKTEEGREDRHPTYYTDILIIHRNLMNSQKSYEFTEIIRIHRNPKNSKKS